jgi:hypothetical protein
VIEESVEIEQTRRCHHAKLALRSSVLKGLTMNESTVRIDLSSDLRSDLRRLPVLASALLWGFVELVALARARWSRGRRV